MGDILKKVAIGLGVFLLLVAFVQGPQEAANMGKDVVGAIKTGVNSAVIFVREVFKAF